MAKKKKEVELKEVSRTEINGAIIIKYEDGSVKIIPAPIMLSAEEAEDLFGSESDDEEEEEEEESDNCQGIGSQTAGKERSQGKGQKRKKVRDYEGRKYYWEGDDPRDDLPF